MRTLLALLTTIFIGCSPEMRVYHEIDSSRAVDQYHTFQWAKTDSAAWGVNPLYFNEWNDRRIKQAVNDLLGAKGYVLSREPSDLTLRYDIRVDEQSMLLPDPYGYLYGDYWMMPRDNLFRYREATLIIDVWHSQTRKLIWRGWAVAAIEVLFNDGKDPEVIIRSAVTKILDVFPAHVVESDTGKTVATGASTKN
ncbi:DUF4136 domain-containing protein [Dyadobacter jiangsuensis]|uniref:Uncharacterized protein DUF4136 n=1 Tax=Dyadobacter jiangsuensis TaxID=1591085 RepID=A0A2P8GIQ0_9BACT|nr:DUF4136 domain-containing protein [Dyadobacter jiangsuensis]PSL33817.1 uncharacterized protein DUF4136 [Dyadobacter jiangsuensis]